MHGRSTSLVSALAGSVLLATAGMGQETAPAGFGFGVTGGIVSLSPQLDQREYGPGLDGFVRYTFSNGVQVLGGASWATVNVENVDDNRDLVGLFVDGRFLLNNVSSLAPYIGVRASYAQHDLKTVINTIATMFIQIPDRTIWGIVR